MALPPEIKSEKVINIHKAIEKMTPEQIGALPSLDEEDFRLFGVIVQHFCFIDLNLRRALEIFCLARLLPQKVAESYPDVRDSRAD